MNELSKSSQYRRHKLLAGVLVATVALAGGAYALAPSKPRPIGATFTYVSTIKGVTINILSARDDAGQPFAYADADYSSQPEIGGTTMGSAPREYGLPKWVDFEWREPAYPGLERLGGETHEAFRARVHEKYRNLVRKKERVYVASKIPPEAIEEVRKAQAETVRGKLPNKMLWVYFVWTPTGIKVRWEVYRAYPGRRTPWQGDPLE